METVFILPEWATRENEREDVQYIQTAHRGDITVPAFSMCLFQNWVWIASNRSKSPEDQFDTVQLVYWSELWNHSQSNP